MIYSPGSIRSLILAKSYREVSCSMSFVSLSPFAFGADCDKGALGLCLSKRDSEPQLYSLPISHINKSSELAVCVDIC